MKKVSTSQFKEINGGTAGYWGDLINGMQEASVATGVGGSRNSASEASSIFPSGNSNSNNSGSTCTGGWRP